MLHSVLSERVAYKRTDGCTELWFLQRDPALRSLQYVCGAFTIRSYFRSLDTLCIRTGACVGTSCSSTPSGIASDRLTVEPFVCTVKVSSTVDICAVCGLV